MFKRLNASTSTTACVSAARYIFTSAFVIAAFAGSMRSHADPADFQAMPGLWKTTVRVMDHGKPGKTIVKWHCVVEDQDPWVGYADFFLPGVQCERSDPQRSSTSLAWQASCHGSMSVSGHARVDFDSPEHYLGGIASDKNGEIVTVEGKRYASCTSPSD